MASKKSLEDLITLQDAAIQALRQANEALTLALQVVEQARKEAAQPLKMPFSNAPNINPSPYIPYAPAPFPPAPMPAPWTSPDKAGIWMAGNSQWTAGNQAQSSGTFDENKQAAFDSMQNLLYQAGMKAHTIKNLLQEPNVEVGSTI